MLMSILNRCRLNRMPGLLCLLLAASLFMPSGETSAATVDGHDDEIRQLITKLENGPQPERRDAILSLHRFGKEAIPFLIANISNDKETDIMLANPRNSDLRLTLAAKTYAGTLAAFVIELILNRTQIKLGPNDHPDFLLGDNPDNYLSWEGVIVKNKGQAKRADLPRIKALYQQWWEANKSESLEKLREKQKSGGRVLDKRPYYWK